MATVDKSHIDLEDGAADGGRHSAALTGGGCNGGRGASSDAGDHSRHSPAGSCASATEVVSVSDKRRESSASECSVVVDLEPEVPQIKTHLANSERDCRICHLSLDAATPESGISIELGCSCKDDLAAAHKQCAEAWFKIKGNRICEICGSTARNIAGSNDAELMGHWNEANELAAATAIAPVPPSGTQRFWQGHRFLNFMLACTVFAFVMSWLFHFNLPS